MYLHKEMSLVDLVFQLFIVCGSKEITTKIPAV